MVTRSGSTETKRFMMQIPAQIEQKLLRSAARAAVEVVKSEAAERVESDVVREALTIKVPKPSGSRVEAKLTIKGKWPLAVGTWLEYGTAPHIIRASADARAGRSIGRMNRQAKDGVLVIGGRFVGDVVHHPGARPHPFLRVSLDVKEGDAIAAAQSYINARVTPTGIVGGDEEDTDA